MLGKQGVKSGFARSLTYIAITKTFDSLGNLSNTSEASTTIYGDWQPITERDSQILESGIAKVGEARLYVKADTNLAARNFIEVDSRRWRLKTRIEPDDVNGVEIAEVWILARDD